jgi:hypothetical protein
MTEEQRAGVTHNDIWDAIYGRAHPDLPDYDAAADAVWALLPVRRCVGTFIRPEYLGDVPERCSLNFGHEGECK